MRNTEKDWVLLDWQTARVRCPYHGLLAESQDYTPGQAVCGCIFVPSPGGLLKALPATAVAGKPLPDST